MTDSPPPAPTIPGQRVAMPQKYILGARLTYRDRGGPTAMRRAFDADGKVVGEWQDCNAMTVVDAAEHDAAIAAMAEGRRMSGAWQPIQSAPHGQRSLVAVHTDEGDEVWTLVRHDDGNFIFEGEPTFCLSYYFEPYAWMPIPEAP